MNRKRNRQVKLIIVIAMAIVVVIVVVRAVVAVPDYLAAVRSSREALLKEDLQVLRGGIHSYRADRQKPPQSLKDLVKAGYLKQVPEDPMTHSNETWVTETVANVQSVKGQADSSGIDDVHSGSQKQGANGRLYSTW